jgi:hypothetical protein
MSTGCTMSPTLVSADPTLDSSTREPIGSDEDAGEPEVECYFCLCRTRMPFQSGNRVFCSQTNRVFRSSCI